MQDRAPPSLSDLMHRGVVAMHSGRVEEAEKHFRQAAAAFADASAYSNLAMALAAQGRTADAVEASRRACGLRPDLAELHGNLGNALQMAGRTDAAIEAYHRALTLRPDALKVRQNLACALSNRGEFGPAIKHLECVLAAEPGNLAGLINLGIARQGEGNLDGAIDAFERAIRLHNPPDAHANLALVLKDAGRVDEAVSHVRRSLEIRPDPKVADLLLLLIQYHPGYDRRQIIEEHHLWFSRYVHGRVWPRVHEIVERASDRKLRIGYVSPDFREHPVGYNVLPLIENHDRGQFEIFCYSNVTRPDSLTERFRAACDHWRNIRPLDDDQAAELIATDHIDVLVDLTLHSGENRLGVFARRPAPVQVTFAGYPGTTGLETIDFRLTDPYLDPPQRGDGGFFEKAVRLKDSFWCYQPIGTEPDLNELPTLANGFMTFGCLNNFCKVNDKVLDVWANVLSTVPHSRLILLAKEGSHRSRTVDYFRGFGVDASRIEFVAPANRGTYLRTYHRVDVALDTFPYNGHTTSLDALWMGVPVVSLVGDLPVGRGGYSQLNNLGLSHLVAPDGGAYATIARELTRDLGALAALRASLRERMWASALCDLRGFVASVESVFRGICRNLTGDSTS
jgi:predicted O-linked N-acetylglucosamine transferase (SPINDLY family)